MSSGRGQRCDAVTAVKMRMLKGGRGRRGCMYGLESKSKSEIASRLRSLLLLLVSHARGPSLPPSGSALSCSVADFPPLGGGPCSVQLACVLRVEIGRAGPRVKGTKQQPTSHSTKGERGQSHVGSSQAKRFDSRRSSYSAIVRTTLVFSVKLSAAGQA